MTDHIYGRDNMVTRTDRPNMFVKELNVYIDYLQNKLDEAKIAMDKKQEKYLVKFTKNLTEGVTYYKNLFSGLKNTFEGTKATVLNELELGENKLRLMGLEIESIKKG